jgi:hypothetical protein
MTNLSMQQVWHCFRLLRVGWGLSFSYFISIRFYGFLTVVVLFIHIVMYSTVHSKY